MRGIFLRKVKDDSGEHWLYEAKGIFGDLQGALTCLPYVYDKYRDENIHSSMSLDSLASLAEVVNSSTEGTPFRVSLGASTRERSSSRRCCTMLLWRFWCTTIPPVLLNRRAQMNS